MKIGTTDVKIGGVFTGPITLDDPVEKVSHDNEASSSKSSFKYTQLRWCPPVLTHTPKRKLQRLRLRKMRDEEAEKKRDEVFNEIKPMVPQDKQWRVKEPEVPTPPMTVEAVATPKPLGLADAVLGEDSTAPSPTGDVDMSEYDDDDLLDYEPTSSERYGH